jgi:hypothetical protein
MANFVISGVEPSGSVSSEFSPATMVCMYLILKLKCRSLWLVKDEASKGKRNEVTGEWRDFTYIARNLMLISTCWSYVM